VKPRGTLYGTLYGAFQRFIHRHNWHHTRTCYPDGNTLVICDWCGLRDVVKRRGERSAIARTGGNP
jgi:hypothetical protein